MRLTRSEPMPLNESLKDSCSSSDLGREMYDLAVRLFPINRSITGNGVRETLRIIGEHIENLSLHEISSGTEVFDWVIPKEWNIRAGKLIGPDGATIADFLENNLHVVGYSTPVDKFLTLEELSSHLHTIEEKPSAIPYVTSYYNPYWGFCLTHNTMEKLEPGIYHALIDSELSEGSLTIGEVLIPGDSEREILISTYTCHPSLGNNEISGPCVTTYLVKWLQGLKSRKYSYRIVFAPETIGAIAYISKNLERLKKNVAGGFVVTCVGDDRGYSLMPSRQGDSYTDRIAGHVLSHISPNYKRWNFYQNRGSDERQYCAPGVDLPVVSMMRTKYGDYPEYHTSLDNLSVVSQQGLFGGYDMLKRTISVFENDLYPVSVVTCEPQLSKRGLRSTIGGGTDPLPILDLVNVWVCCDGTKSLFEISELIGIPFWRALSMYRILLEHNIVRFSKEKIY